MSDISAYADVIVATVDNLLLKGNPVVYVVSVRIDIDDFTGAEKPAVVGYVHLACHAPNNYMAVYAAYTPQPAWVWPDVAWTKVCQHDSAWRDDGIRSTLRTAHQAIVKHAEIHFGRPASSLSCHLGIDNMALTTTTAVFGRSSPVFVLGSLDVVSMLAAG